MGIEQRELTATVHKACAHAGCTRPALMAISTTRGKTLFSRVFYDVAEAPPSASPYCHEDGVATMVGLISTLVPPDADGAPPVAEPETPHRHRASCHGPVGELQCGHDEVAR